MFTFGWIQFVTVTIYHLQVPVTSQRSTAGTKPRRLRTRSAGAAQLALAGTARSRTLDPYSEGTAGNAHAVGTQGAAHTAAAAAAAAHTQAACSTQGAAPAAVANTVVDTATAVAVDTADDTAPVGAAAPYCRTPRAVHWTHPEFCTAPRTAKAKARRPRTRRTKALGRNRRKYLRVRSLPRCQRPTRSPSMNQSRRAKPARFGRHGGTPREIRGWNASSRHLVVP